MKKALLSGLLPDSVEVLSGGHGFHSTELFNEALINNALVLCFLVWFSCVVC